MQLFSSDLSPFSARVRIQVRMKQLPVEILPPPEPLRSVAFKQLFPLGKIPVLRTESGDLAESWAIMEYLEECFPEPSLLPATAWERGQMRMRAAFTDQYFGPSFATAFFYLIRPSGDAPSLQPMLAQADTLERLLTGRKHELVQLDDIALATSFNFALAVTRALQQPEWLESRPAIRGWWQWISQQTEVATAIREMDQSFQAMLAR